MSQLTKYVINNAGMSTTVLAPAEKGTEPMNASEMEVLIDGQPTKESWYQNELRRLSELGKKQMELDKAAAAEKAKQMDDYIFGEKPKDQVTEEQWAYRIRPAPVTQGRTFSTGAYRDENTSKLDWSGFLSPNALRYFAEYMHKNRLQSNGVMRGSENWKLGMPIDCYKESMIRHIFEFWMVWDRAKGRGQIVGNAKERAEMIESLCGALFNLQGMLHELEKWDEREKNIPSSTRAGTPSAGEEPSGADQRVEREANAPKERTGTQSWGKGSLGDIQCQKVAEYPRSSSLSGEQLYYLERD